MAEKDIIVVETNGVNEIEIENESKLCFVKAGETKSLSLKNKNTKKRWVWIAAEYLPYAEVSWGLYSKWGEWKNKKETAPDIPIEIYGIGKQYTFNHSVRIKAASGSNFTKGTIFYVEPFTDEPTLKNGYYIATIDTPKILSAYFAKYKDEFKYPNEDGKSNVYTYKNSIRLYVLTHMIPDYTVKYHNFALFEVDIHDTEGHKVTKTPMQFFQKTKTGVFTVNTLTELNFEIDEAWRKESEHQKGKVKKYFATIKVTIYSNEDAFTGEEVNKIEESFEISANKNPRNRGLLKYTNKFKSVAPNSEEVGFIYTDEDEVISEIGWGRTVNQGIAHAKKYKKTVLEIHDTQCGTVLKNQQTTFDVRYDTMDVILDKYEVSKNNMFAVIGDVNYSSKEAEPCKFTKIQIEHKSRTEPFVLFDEGKKTSAMVDQTNLAFGIVAGDAKETIKITAEGLAIQSYHPDLKAPPICLGITTAKKVRKNGVQNKKVKHRNQEEFMHNGIEDVFNMEKAYLLHPGQNTFSKWSYEGTTGDETIDIRDQGIKYKLLENGIELEVGYLYNKTYDTQVEKILGSKSGEWTNDLIDKAWILRYFLLKDNQAQNYFIPISTCRYPNQIARIQLYPDINWAITFTFGDVDPTHSENWQKGLTEKKQKLIAKHKENLKPFNRNKPLSTTEKKKEEALKKLNISLGIKASYGTDSINLTTDLGKKINDFIYAFAVAKNLIDKVSGNEASKKEQNNLYQKRVNKLASKHGSKWLKKLAKAPITITVHQPSFSVVFAWGRKSLESQTNAAVPIAYDVFLKAAPLLKIEGSLDLITCATFIPVAGQVIKVADIVLNVVGVTPVFKLTAMGSIGVSIVGTVKIDGDTNESKLERKIDADMKLTIEASITVGGGLVGFMFAGGDIKGAFTESTYTASAETGFELDLTSGVTAHKGVYIGAKLDFLGLIAVGKKETKRNKVGGSSEELFRYTIVEKTNFIDKTFYF